MQQAIRPLLQKTLRVAIGASAIAFAVLLIVFVVILFAAGIDEADKVWKFPWTIISWCAALPLSLKLLWRKK